MTTEKHGAAEAMFIRGKGQSVLGDWVIPCCCGREITGPTREDAIGNMVAHSGVLPYIKGRRRKPESPELEGVDWEQFKTTKKRAAR